MNMQYPFWLLHLDSAVIYASIDPFCLGVNQEQYGMSATDILSETKAFIAGRSLCCTVCTASVQPKISGE